VIDTTPAGAGPDQLTDDERAILAFETQTWRRPGAKEQAIRDQFGITATRYAILLNQLVDRPAALAHAPHLIRRLDRLRSGRRGMRSR
jgi:hypothetical protein